LFDIVQPWMDKTRSILVLGDLSFWLFHFRSDYASGIFHLYRDIPIKVNYKRMMQFTTYCSL
jgi:hypothetical protein